MLSEVELKRYDKALQKYYLKQGPFPDLTPHQLGQVRAYQREHLKAKVNTQ